MRIPLNHIVAALFALLTFPLAKAEGERSIYLNSFRGYAGLGGEQGATLMIHGADADSVVNHLMLPSAIHYPEVEMIISNRHAKSPWGIEWIERDGRRQRIVFRMQEDSDEITGGRFMNIALPEAQCVKLRKGMDLYGGRNRIRLSFSPEGLSLSAGNHGLRSICSGLKAESPVAIGLFTSAGGELELISLSVEGRMPSPYMLHPTVRSIEDVRSLVEDSDDPSEGVWSVLDSSFDESLARSGGEYRFALVKRGDGYDLVYLGGAAVLGEHWHPGMIKARLLKNPAKDVFDVEWVDSEGSVISKGVKAQFESHSLLNIQFPYQSARMRLQLAF